MRLDSYLVEAGLVASRSRAKDLIAQGLVTIGGHVAAKANIKIDAGNPPTIKVDDHPWVSRAGLKLAGACEIWPELTEAIKGAVCMDLGSSTGGFTQVLLHQGAAKVFAIDVGTDQLHADLCKDDRVVSLEQTNCRDLSQDLVPEAPQVLVSDLSFISLKTALPAALGLASSGAWLMALIKPQFEAGRDRLGKGGVVRDPGVVEEVEAELRDWFQAQGWPVKATKPSPILGPDGNAEILCLARKL